MSVYVYSGGPTPPAEGRLEGMTEAQRWHLMFLWVYKRRQGSRRKPQPGSVEATLVGQDADGANRWTDVAAVGVAIQ